MNIKVYYIVLEDDFKDESKWPFIKESLINFFKGDEIIHHADR